MIFTNSKNSSFKAEFEELLGRGKMDIAHVSAIVGNIIDEINKFFIFSPLEFNLYLKLV